MESLREQLAGGETQHRHGCFEIEAGRSIDNMSNTFEHIVYIRYNVKTCQVCEWKSWTWEEDVGLWRMMWNYVEFAPFARDKESPCSISHVGLRSSYTVGCCARLNENWLHVARLRLGTYLCTLLLTAGPRRKSWDTPCKSHAMKHTSRSQVLQWYFFTNNVTGDLRALSIQCVPMDLHDLFFVRVVAITERLRQSLVFYLSRRRGGRQCRVSSWSPVHVAFPELKTWTGETGEREQTLWENQTPATWQPLKFRMQRDSEKFRDHLSFGAVRF